MSIELQIKSVDFDQSPKDNIELHYIPASIDENVVSNMKNYFNSYTYEENGVLKNSLRGYPLDGCKMKLPEKYQGIVYQESQCPLDENARRFFRAKGIFKQFHYWNYDKEPSNNDALKQAFVWNDLADVLHEPITMEEFENDTVDTRKTEEK